LVSICINSRSTSPLAGNGSLAHRAWKLLTLEWRGEDEALPQINLDEGDPEPEAVIAGDRREQLTLVEVAATVAEAPPDP
jgi:hypothetical protein